MGSSGKDLWDVDGREGTGVLTETVGGTTRLLHDEIHSGPSGTRSQSETGPGIHLWVPDRRRRTHSSFGINTGESQGEPLKDGPVFSFVTSFNVRGVLTEDVFRIWRDLSKGTRSLKFVSVFPVGNLH